MDKFKLSLIVIIYFNISINPCEAFTTFFERPPSNFEMLVRAIKATLYTVYEMVYYGVVNRSIELITLAVLNGLRTKY
jgi:hypothetical protein